MTKSNSVKEQVIVNAVEEQENDQTQFDQVVTNGVGYKNTIKTLIGNGCKRLNGIRIKNVNYTEKDNYTMISFTLANQIKGFVSNDNGSTYELGMTSILFTSLYAVTGTLKEDENLGWMSNTLLDKPTSLNLIFNGATIDIIQQEVVAGEEYSNPFSTKAEPIVYDHDIIINHIVGFKLGATGTKMADMLASKLMGF